MGPGCEGMTGRTRRSARRQYTMGHPGKQTRFAQVSTVMIRPETNIGAPMLEHPHPTLPSRWYFDAAHYQRELQSIWWREWLCVARVGEFVRPGDFRLIRVGGQQVLVTLSASGGLQAFHNTCRHRGSLLCETDSGHFPQQRIVCPYHAWTYSLDGELMRTPRKPETPEFRPEAHALYRVALDTWGGYVFINLAEQPAGSLADALGTACDPLGNWPMAELALAHREMHTVESNWKIFWENFLECYHCPNIHRDLCALVPMYGEGVNSPGDLPVDSLLRPVGGGSLLRPGAITWSADGQSTLPRFEGLSKEEQAVGMTFANVLPSVFIVAHVDYVRSVHVLPLGPERTLLTVNWLLMPDTLASGNIDIPALTAFGRQVVMEDARVCGLNQQGLHCLRHQHGSLAPQEYDLLAFDDWVRHRLAATPPDSQDG